MGPPKFVIGNKAIATKTRAVHQVATLTELVERTPLIELPVDEWYEISGYFLGLRLLLTERERDLQWADVKAFKQGLLQEKHLSTLARLLHAFEIIEGINRRRWTRETGYDAERWERIKRDPTRHEKKKQQNAAVQRKRRAVRKAENLSSRVLGEQPDSHRVEVANDVVSLPDEEAAQ